MTIYGYSIGVKQSGSGSSSGGGSGKASVSSFTFVKHLDPSSPGLFAAAAKGQHFKTARADINGPGGASPFASYCFTDAAISSDTHQADGTSGSEPLETVDLQFSGLSVNYSIASPFSEYVQPIFRDRRGNGVPCSNAVT